MQKAAPAKGMHTNTMYVMFYLVKSFILRVEDIHLYVLYPEANEAI
jgi:hypothetical protein